MILVNDIGLIGDALGSIPFTIALAEKVNKEGDTLYVDAANKTIFDMIPKKYGIKSISEYPSGMMPGPSLRTNLTATFNAHHNLYMTQAHFAHFSYYSLPVPNYPIRPEIDIGEEPKDLMECDFILAPFSRSLPPNQAWPIDRFKQLASLFPDKKFIVLGNNNEPDNNPLVDGPNISCMYGQPLKNVGHVMKKAKYGMVSVVTGLSHFSYALNVHTIQLTVQAMNWGNCPDGTRIGHPTGDVRNIQVNTVANSMRIYMASLDNK